MLTAPLLASVIRDALHHFQSEDKDVVKGCCWSAGCLWSGLGGSGVLAVLALCSLRSVPPCSGYATAGTLSLLSLRIRSIVLCLRCGYAGLLVLLGVASLVYRGEMILYSS